MQINNNFSASYMASANKSRQNIAGDTKRTFSDVAVTKAEEAEGSEDEKKRPRLF